MTNEKLKKLILTALFAALACIATMIMKIPTPGTGGYIHVGDAIVILSGVVLGPWYGFAAAGLGSCMADLIGGYFIYVPITFVIKGLIALATGLVYRAIGKSNKMRYAGVLLGGVIDIVFVAGGYLRILHLWSRSFRKHSCQHHSGCRRTDHLRSALSGTDRSTVYSPAGIRHYR